MMLFQLFVNFFFVGLFSVGGGYAAIPLIQSRIVDGMGWLSMSAFTDLMTIAEMTPGPIAVNCATFVGFRLAGLPGAIAATLGNIMPSLIIVSLMAYVYRRYHSTDLVSGVLGSLRPVVVALIASALVSILRQVVFLGAEIKVIETLLFLAAFAALRFLKAPPILTMFLCGAAGLGLHLLFGGVG